MLVGVAEQSQDLARAGGREPRKPLSSRDTYSIRVLERFCRRSVGFGGMKDMRPARRVIARVEGSTVYLVGGAPPLKVHCN